MEPPPKGGDLNRGWEGGYLKVTYSGDSYNLFDLEGYNQQQIKEQKTFKCCIRKVHLFKAILSNCLAKSRLLERVSSISLLITFVFFLTN